MPVYNTISLVLKCARLANIKVRIVIYETPHAHGYRTYFRVVLVTFCGLGNLAVNEHLSLLMIMLDEIISLRLLQKRKVYL